MSDPLQRPLLHAARPALHELCPLQRRGEARLQARAQGDLQQGGWGAVCFLSLPKVNSCQITSVLDGNVVYSNEPDKLDDLRSYEGGLMKTLPVFR